MARTRQLIFLCIVAVCGLCMYMVTDRAHAAGCTRIGSDFTCETEGDAYGALTGLLITQECNNYSAGYVPTGSMTVTKFNVSSYHGRLPCATSSGQWPVVLSYTASFKTRCDSRTDYNGAFPSMYGTPISGSYSCNSGCMQVWTPNADGTWNGSYGANVICSMDPNDHSCGELGQTGYHWNSYLKVCEPDDPDKCPNGQVKDSSGKCVDDACPSGMVMQQDGTCAPAKTECPPGQVRSPAGGCLPGDGQCAQGEVRGKDGTCKRDGDGDGQPDAGEEDGTADPTFSGGDNCDSPPSCSGDVIMCGQARIQWRIDCNTRKNRNVSGGTCDRVPICTGEKCDSMEYSSMLFQWRSACAAEKLLQRNGAGEGDSAAVNAIKDALAGNAGTPDIGAEGDPSGAFSDGSGDGGLPSGELDTSGFGYSRTCPTIPSVTVLGTTLNFDTSVFCQWLVLGGQIVLVMAALMSLRIISSSGEG